MEKKRKKLFIALGCVGGVLLALAVFLLVWYFGASYPKFYETGRDEFEIPGLNEGLCPQGICTLPDNDMGYDFAVSGYLAKEEPSRIYFVDEGGKAKTKYIEVVLNGQTETTHFGGVACSDDTVFVASEKNIVCLPLREALNAKNGGAVNASGAFATGFRSNAFCQYYENMLYVGEFYRPGNYETDESHHMKTADGSMNYALVYGYGVGEGVGGLNTEAPELAISVREQVQGIAVYDGGIALSCSYGLPDSGIWAYENVLGGEASGLFDVNGVSVPLYMLDSSNCKGVLSAPCMSEEIAVKNGRLYILFESLSDKYKLFTRTRMSHVQSVSLAALEELG